MNTEVHIVNIHPEGDGMTALYLDGELFRTGDYYHDKIDDWIEGFIAGLEYGEVPVKQKRSYVLESSRWIEDLLCEPPSHIDDYPPASLSETYE